LLVASAIVWKAPKALPNPAHPHAGKLQTAVERVLDYNRLFLLG